LFFFVLSGQNIGGKKIAQETDGTKGVAFRTVTTLYDKIGKSMEYVLAKALNERDVHSMYAGLSMFATAMKSSGEDDLSTRPTDIDWLRKVRQKKLYTTRARMPGF
jgi:hypothetical protein